MAKKSTFKVKFRRRREGKTNYVKRVALIKSGLPKLVVRKSNRYFTVQVVEYSPKGDKTVVHVNSKHLQKIGWKASCKNLSAAYLTGVLAGVNAKKKKAEKAVLDIGFATPVHGSGCYAALKGALDAGMQISAGKEALPSDERAAGKHIEQFAKKLGSKAGERFSKAVKAGVDLQNLGKKVEEMREKILRG